MKLPLTVTGKIHVILRSDGEVFLASSTFAGCEGYVCLGTSDVTLDVPQEDPTAKRIEALENKIEDVTAEYQADMRSLREKIRDLHCLEHKES